MPTNLPPQYFEAEKGYRLAKSTPDKINALATMLSSIPKHKGTDKLRAELRRKMAKLTEQSQKKPTIAKRQSPYNIKKEGAGQVVLIGFPNVGKSQIVSSMTNASPEVADYLFTTQNPTPGMMRFENIQIQLVDTPPLTKESGQAWLSTIFRNADALLLVLDLTEDPVLQTETLIEELEKLKIEPIGKQAKEPMEAEAIQKKALVVGNKHDVKDSNQNYSRLKSRLSEKFEVVPISAKERVGLEELRKGIYRALDIIRVYTKSPGKKPDLQEPVILKKESTVEHFAQSIHKDFLGKMRYAQIWGSAKYDGQKVKRNYILEDGDVVELHI